MARDKRAVFERLANQRTNAVLEKIRVLGHCANRQLYEFDDDDVKAVFRAIREELKNTEARFNGIKHKEFQLKHR